MNVLITGGYGFIGAWIMRNLIRRGDRAFVYDLKEDPRRLRLVVTEEEAAQAVFVPGDVTDLDGLKGAITDNGITHVIHLAGLQVPFCKADPILGAKVNVIGTLAIFEAIRQTGEQVKRLVYASSAAVFGPPDAYEPGALDDDVKLVPSTHYGVYKACNEGNARIYYQDNGLSSIGLRPWTVYGVGRDQGMTSEPTKAILALAKGEPCHISYGGSQDFQFADDVAKTFLRCLEAPYEGSKSYNMRGIVADMETFHKALCAVEPAAKELVTYGTSQLAIAPDLDDSALRRDVGEIPLTPLEDGIRQTLEAFRELHRQGRLSAEG